MTLVPNLNNIPQKWIELDRTRLWYKQILSGSLVSPALKKK